MKKDYILYLFIFLNFSVFSQQEEWVLGPFERFTDSKPILEKNEQSVFQDPISGKTAHWESMATFNPAAILRNDTIFVLYRAEEKLGEKEIGGHRSRIGMAYSLDGLQYTSLPEPVFYPQNDAQKGNEFPGGVEDPRIVETEDGVYVLTYTQWNREVPRLAVATSKDLKTWQKFGPVFHQHKEGKYLDRETKSGAIVTKLEDGKLLAVKIDGKYWMYFGVPNIYLASSEDLIHWTPVENHEGNLAPVLTPRPGYFDSWLVEAGPPPLLTENGIVVLYNAGNSGNIGIPELGNRVYTGGQALFSSEVPWKLMDRSEVPFIKPELDFEKSGQYEDGTTFVEGLIWFKKSWYLYYGTADSMVGVVRTKE
ncbi:glycoside hydrolase family 130 protein [Gramella sp. AN32]|uniref:Glycoside hydrolase family 130 protein n=1 Tax=Christiangramia antarctica TaxID=2058158 RepID=A0ABW5X5Q0_9FLAO|nr:glycoside hydrolase family 130 protein [Gramella sp. AN32]MCM4156284.1 pesticidal protein Cry15Aa [Gramella sp. AN32]